MKTSFKVIAFFFLVSSQPLLPQSTTPLKINQRIHINGDGGWDLMCVDQKDQHLFISHGTVVQVFDISSKKIIATMEGTKGVHGIAVANEFNKGFTSNGGDTSVTVFNLKTLTVSDKVKIAGINPDAIIYDEFSKRVFVFNGKSHDVTVIEAQSNKIVGTIKLEGKPELTCSDGKGKVFVNLEDKAMIVVIDTKSLEVKNAWSIAPGEEPTGLAYDTKYNRLFSVCSNKMMMVIDANTGKVVTSVPIGEGCDGVEFDPEKKCIYASNGDDGSITVVKQENADAYTVIQTLETKKGAKTIALSHKTHQLFTPAGDYGIKPAATTENPRPKKPVLPNTFELLICE